MASKQRKKKKPSTSSSSKAKWTNPTGADLLKVYSEFREERKMKKWVVFNTPRGGGRAPKTKMVMVRPSTAEFDTVPFWMDVVTVVAQNISAIYVSGTVSPDKNYYLMTILAGAVYHLGAAATLDALSDAFAEVRAPKNPPESYVDAAAEFYVKIIALHPDHRNAEDAETIDL